MKKKKADKQSAKVQKENLNEILDGKGGKGGKKWFGL